MVRCGHFGCLTFAIFQIKLLNLGKISSESCIQQTMYSLRSIFTLSIIFSIACKAEPIPVPTTPASPLMNRQIGTPGWCQVGQYCCTPGCGSCNYNVCCQYADCGALNFPARNIVSNSTDTTNTIKNSTLNAVAT